MKQFQFSLVPCTISPTIRNMHRQTHKLWAVDLDEAKIVLATAFPGGADLTGEWFIEKGSIKECPLSDRAEWPAEHGQFGVGA